jgi:hypothetical protein
MGGCKLRSFITVSGGPGRTENGSLNADFPGIVAHNHCPGNYYVV